MWRKMLKGQSKYFEDFFSHTVDEMIKACFLGHEL